MAVNHTTIPQGNGKQRQLYMVAALMMLGAGVCVLLAMTGVGTSLTRPFGISESRSDMGFGVATGILFTLAAALFWKARFHCGPKAEEIDATHARQRQVLTGVTIMTIAYAGLAMMHAVTGTGPDFSILFAPLALCVALVTTFGVGFARKRYRIAADDELVRHLRWRAAQLGYVLAAAGLAVSYMVWLFHSAWMPLVLPVALLTAAVAPAIWFIVAEGRAAADA